MCMYIRICTNFCNSVWVWVGVSVDVGGCGWMWMWVGMGVDLSGCEWTRVCVWVGVGVNVSGCGWVFLYVYLDAFPHFWCVHMHFVGTISMYKCINVCMLFHVNMYVGVFYGYMMVLVRFV